MAVFAYITNASSKNVSVIDAATGQVAKTIAVAANPLGVAVSPDNTKVYVSQFVAGSGASTPGTIAVINPTTGTVSTTITVGVKPYGVKFSPSGTKAYVANNGDGTISVISPATGAVTATITGISTPTWLAFSPDGSKAYVISGNTVAVVNVATNAKTKTIPVGSLPYGVAFSPDGTKAYVANLSSSSLSVIDTASDTVTKTVALSTNPGFVAFSPDGSRAYVTAVNDTFIFVLNAATDALITTIPVGSGPYGVEFTPDGSRAYVQNSGDNTVSIINTATGAVAATTTVGSSPKQVAFLSVSGPRTVTIAATCTGKASVLKRRGVVIAALCTTSTALAQARVRFVSIIAAARARVQIDSPQLRIQGWRINLLADPFALVRNWRVAWFLSRGVPMISPAALLHYLDKIAGNVLTADYQAAANALAGDGTDLNPSISRVLVGGDGVSSLVYGSGDEQFIIDMGPVTDLYVANADVFAQLTLRHGTLMQKLNDTLSKMGAGVLVGGAAAFSDLDTYASYQNSLAPGSFRVLPQIALLQFIYNARQGSRLMKPANVAAPVTHLGSGSVGQNSGGANAAVVWTPDSSVRLVNDAGAALQGYSAAKGAAVRVTQMITGTLTLTVTASGQDSTGAIVGGRTWTAVLDNAAAGTVVPLVPGVAGDRIASVPMATGAGAATAGGFDVVTVNER